MTVAMAPTRTEVKPTMSPESREVLVRIVEYALEEARREGETACACHLYQALDALTRAADNFGLGEPEWHLEMANKPHLVS